MSSHKNKDPWIHDNIRQIEIDSAAAPLTLCTLHIDKDEAWGDIGAW